MELTVCTKCGEVFNPDLSYESKCPSCGGGI